MQQARGQAKEFRKGETEQGTKGNWQQNKATGRQTVRLRHKQMVNDQSPIRVTFFFVAGLAILQSSVAKAQRYYRVYSIGCKKI